LQLSAAEIFTIFYSSGEAAGTCLLRFAYLERQYFIKEIKGKANGILRAERGRRELCPGNNMADTGSRVQVPERMLQVTAYE
jgi:hypothetical protein